jgi:hypothetical protein
MMRAAEGQTHRTQSQEVVEPVEPPEGNAQWSPDCGGIFVGQYDDKD